VSFRITYAPPPRRPENLPDDPEEALYDLGDAGATAGVELDGYALPLHGIGLVELGRACRALLEVLDTGTPRSGDEDLRAALPGVSEGALLHSWLFGSYQYLLPMLVFAVDGAETLIFTRTWEESDVGALVALDGRDLEDPVPVPTATVAQQARRFLAAAQGR
jgi:hypothetical protein